MLYKDHGDAYVTRTQLAFTNDADAVVQAIQDITVDGGGDWPEAVYSAIVHAVEAKDQMGEWRGSDNRKAIILMGDAPAPWAEPADG